MNHGKVYAVQDVHKKNPKGQGLVRLMDITSAAKFGELEVLLPDYAVAFTPGPMIDELSEKLRHFCDDDFLIAIGDPSAIAAAIMIASNNNRGKVNLLKWDRKAGAYLKIPLDINYRRNRAKDRS